MTQWWTVSWCHTLIWWNSPVNRPSILNYHKTSNISCTFIGNKTVDHSDVVGALPVGAAPITSSFSTPGFNGLGRRQLYKEPRNISVLGFGAAYIRGLKVLAWIHNKVGDTMNPQSWSQTPQCHSTHWRYCPNGRRCLGYSNIHFINWLTEAWWKSLPYHVSILLCNKTIHTFMKNKILPVTQHLSSSWLATQNSYKMLLTSIAGKPVDEIHLYDGVHTSTDSRLHQLYESMMKWES